MRATKKNKWQRSIEEHIKWLLWTTIGVLLGVIYAILKRKDEAMFFLMYTFINNTSGEGGKLEIFKQTLVSYGLQISLLWCCGLAHYTRGFIPFFLVGYSFCYGFCIGLFLIMYGFRGIAISLGVLGVQMLVMTNLYRMISQRSDGLSELAHTRKNYYATLVTSVWSVMGLGLYNVYVQPLIEKITIG